MMIKRTAILLCIILCATVPLFCQSPGYMGKHMSVAYGLNTSPALFGYDRKQHSIAGTEGNAETNHLAFNIIQEASLEYVTSKQWSIGFSVRYYKTTFDNPTLLVEHTREVLYNSKKNPTGYYDITGLSYSLYVKRYHKKYLAPWGRYMVFGLVLNTAKMNYDPEVMYNQATAQDGSSYPGYTYRDTLINNFGPQTQSYKGINLMLGFGRTRILYNRLILDYGFNMYLLSGFPNLALTYKGNITPETYIQKTVNRRIRGINHFNVFLKVGVLLF